MNESKISIEAPFWLTEGYFSTRPNQQNPFFLKLIITNFTGIKKNLVILLSFHTQSVLFLFFLFYCFIVLGFVLLFLVLLTVKSKIDREVVL